MIRYTRTQHRPPSRQVNDHGRVSGTHRDPGRVCASTAARSAAAAASKAHRRRSRAPRSAVR